jgi:hypothetical protein
MQKKEKQNRIVMKAEAVLSLRSKNNSEVFVYADHIISKVTEESLFDLPHIKEQLAVTSLANKSLLAAMAEPLSETKTDHIRAARATLDRELTILAGYIVALANKGEHPHDVRASIIHAAGLDVMVRKPRKKNSFTVVSGLVGGSVFLKAAGEGVAHEWQFSTDLVNFENRKAAPATTTASTEITGLESGTRYVFFHRSVQAGVNTPWEGPLFLTVQ